MRTIMYLSILLTLHMILEIRYLILHMIQTILVLFHSI
nr:MAG TPA: hypothetical protein [Caudoviricetes sp.]